MNVPLRQLESGHIAIYGATQSGKTFYAKTIIKHVIKPDYVYVFIGSPDAVNWEKYGNDNPKLNVKIYKDWESNKDVIKACSDNAMNNKSNVIVFDDFNTRINGNNDKIYEELFTQGRHFNIRVINMSQTGKGISKNGRENIRYMCTLYSNNMELIKGLANNFLNNDYARMNNAINSIKGTKNVVLLDTRTGEITIDNAMNYKDEIIIKPRFTDMDNVDMPDMGVNNNLDNRQRANDTINAGITRNVLNNGTFNDNTSINFQNNIDNRKKLEDNSFNQYVTKINYDFQREMKRKSERDECFDLTQKYRLTLTERQRLIELLKYFCKVPVNIETYKHYAQKFLDKYYKGHVVGSGNKVYDHVIDNIDVAVNPSLENVSEFALRHTRSFANSMSDSNSFIGRAIRNTPIKYLTDKH